MEYPFHVKDIRISDPFILADPVTRKYYTYASVFNPERYPGQRRAQEFHALVSEDLIHWSDPIKVFDREETDFWGCLDYWAPECHYYKGRYYLISSFRAPGTLRRCQALVADSPLGPFKPIADGPVTPEGWQCLDGTLFEDHTGTPWMVFCHEWTQVGDGQIAAVPLSEDLGTRIGDPVILFRASDSPWVSSFVSNGPCGFVTDGPFLHRMKDGSLIMLWSDFTDNGYATGYAKSASGMLRGPWIHRKNPLYFHDGAHSMLFHTFDGKLMMSLHAPNRHTDKHMMLFEMEERNGELYIVNEITGNWYNYAERPKGSGFFKEPYNDHRGF